MARYSNPVQTVAFLQPTLDEPREKAIFHGMPYWHENGYKGFIPFSVAKPLVGNTWIFPAEIAVYNSNIWQITV